MILVHCTQPNRFVYISNCKVASYTQLQCVIIDEAGTVNDERLEGPKFGEFGEL